MDERDEAAYEREDVTLIGNVTADLALRATGKGIQVTGFTVACSPEQFDEELNRLVPVEGTRFVRFTAWRQLAEHAVASFRRGTRVIGKGRLRVTTFKRRDGQEELQVEFNVREVGPSVLFAIARPVAPSEASRGAE